MSRRRDLRIDVIFLSHISYQKITLLGMSFFLEEQLLPLYPAIGILIISIFLFSAKKEKAAIASLFIGIVVLGLFMANLDPFLILWDEQYHALVAKNMVLNPFKPMLYIDPVLPYDYVDWTSNHIWLHKQPLFLWQMALSIKLFGATELSVRIPSVLMHALTAFAIYRIGTIVINRRVGFYGALIFGVAYYQLELVAGRFTTDHNDVAFLFYVIASIWAWFEYQRSQKGIYLILIGIFSGGAILVKWLVGLIVYAIWFFSLGAASRRNWLSPNAYKPILKSLLITVAVFLPWQIFIHFKYPSEAAYEAELNTRHFFKVIEDHGGDFWFHFRVTSDIYGSGDLIPLLIIAGLVMLLTKTKNPAYRVALFVFPVIIYLFYSIAATKMNSFTILVAPIIYLGFGTLVDSLMNWLESITGKVKILNAPRVINVLRFCLVIGFSFMCLNLSKIEKNHTMKKPLDNFGREKELAQKDFINSAKALLTDANYVVFNTDIRFNGNVSLMFYTGLPAYGQIPSQEEIQIVKQKNYKVAIRDNGDLPDYIQNDSSIVIIPGFER